MPVGSTSQCDIRSVNLFGSQSANQSGRQPSHAIVSPPTLLRPHNDSPHPRCRCIGRFGEEDPRTCRFQQLRLQITLGSAVGHMTKRCFAMTTYVFCRFWIVVARSLLIPWSWLYPCSIHKHAAKRRSKHTADAHVGHTHTHSAHIEQTHIHKQHTHTRRTTHIAHTADAQQEHIRCTEDTLKTRVETKQARSRNTTDRSQTGHTQHAPHTYFQTHIR